ncbi:hypothetical protein K9M09_02675 [Patescibacteria group bacterium]|nr:hypothetical protein [Patescibacteria group bacterium]
MEKAKNKSIFLYQATDPSVVFIIAACKYLKRDVQPLVSMPKLWELWESWRQKKDLVFIHSQMDVDIFYDWQSFLNIATDAIGSYINPRDIQATDSHPETHKVLDFMAESGLLKDAKDSLRPERWEKNKLAERYGKALSAAKIFLENQKKRDNLLQLFENAATEILSGKENFEVTKFAESFVRCVKALNEASAKLSVNEKPFIVAGRKVAYAYLDNLSPWLDLEEFKKRSLNTYPFLTILQYREDNKEYTWMGSKGIININQIFDIKSNNPYRALIQGSYTHTIARLKKEAEQFC